MKKSDQTVQLSVRLPAQSHQNLVIEAERQGATVAEVARQRLQQAEKQLELNELLRGLASMLTQSMFTITSFVAGLNDQEHEQVKVKLEAQLKRRLK
jgi:hypothetical protein